MAVERIKNGVGIIPYSDCFFFADPGDVISPGTHPHIRQTDSRNQAIVHFVYTNQVRRS